MRIEKKAVFCQILTAVTSDEKFKNQQFLVFNSLLVTVNSFTIVIPTSRKDIQDTCILYSSDISLHVLILQVPVF